MPIDGYIRTRHFAFKSSESIEKLSPKEAKDYLLQRLKSIEEIYSLIQEKAEEEVERRAPLLMKRVQQAEEDADRVKRQADELIRRYEIAFSKIEPFFEAWAKIKERAEKQLSDWLFNPTGRNPEYNRGYVAAYLEISGLDVVEIAKEIPVSQQTLGS